MLKWDFMSLITHIHILVSQTENILSGVLVLFKCTVMSRSACCYIQGIIFCGCVCVCLGADPGTCLPPHSESDPVGDTANWGRASAHCTEDRSHSAPAQGGFLSWQWWHREEDTRVSHSCCWCVLFYEWFRRGVVPMKSNGVVFVTHQLLSKILRYFCTKWDHFVCLFVALERISGGNYFRLLHHATSR